MVIERPPPAEPILDRHGAKEWVAEHLADQVSYLGTLCDYGVQLLKRSLAVSDRETPSIVVLPVLFRQVLAQLDAIHLHLEHGAVHSSVPDLRALFEATLAMEWILKGPPEKREPDKDWMERWGRQFYVSELRQERSWARASIPGTPEHEELRRAAPELVEDMDSEVVSQASSRVHAIDKYIARHPELERINQTFIPVAEKMGREPSWYRPGGPSSLADMAGKLGRSDAYKVLYRQWSEVSHASRTKPHIQILTGHTTGHTLIIEPIRFAEGLGDVLQMASTYAETAIGLVLEKYRPEELRVFAMKWKGWEPMRQIPEIQVTTEVRGRL